MATLTIISFGYEHGPAPEADATYDVRRSLRDAEAEKHGHGGGR